MTRSVWQILKCNDSVELHRGKCYVNYCHTLVSSRDYGKKRARNEDNDVKDDEVKENGFITAIFLSSFRVFAIIFDYHPVSVIHSQDNCRTVSQKESFFLEREFQKFHRAKERENNLRIYEFI